MDKRIILLLIMFFIILSNSFGKHRQTCVVQYMTEDGLSKKYNVEVTFMTGSELNEATDSYKYSSYKVYAIIFWGKNEASVIKLTSFLACGNIVDEGCIQSFIGVIKGIDQDEDEWRICISNLCL